MDVKCKSCGLTMAVPDHLAGREFKCQSCKEPFVVPDSKPCPFCAETIKIAAKVCKHCGRDLVEIEMADEAPALKSTSHNVSPITAVVVIAFAALAVWGFISLGPTGSTTTSDGRFVAPQSIASPPPVVTKVEYDRLAEGMSYQKAVEIIGARGEEVSRSDLAGFTTVMYSWMNSNGSNMNAMFQNGELVSKAQFGLP